MAKRDKPALPDWHLWSEVAQTVSPLHRTRIREALKLQEQPLPLPDHRCDDRLHDQVAAHKQPAEHQRQHPV